MPTESRYNLKKIIIVGVIVLILAGLIGFYFINKKNATNNGSGTDKNLFPFGQGTTNTPGGPVVAPGEATLDNIGDNPLTVTDGARLRHITDYPITNFISQIINRVVTEPKLDEKTGQTVLASTIVPTNMVRFNAKQNGFIIDGEITNDAIIVQQRTKSSIPNAEELWFGSQGNTVTYRTWNGTTQVIDSLNAVFPSTQNNSYCLNPFTTDLKKGSKGTQVLDLQKYLNAKLSISITADGSFGAKTSGLLKNLQKILGVPETGILDLATRTIINADCTSIQTALSKKSQEPISLNGTLLAPNILRGTVSPDGSKIFYLRETADGTIGTVIDSNGLNQRQIFISAISEWQPNWVSADTITMTTLASREANGYMYFLTPSTGAFKKVLGPVRGLTTLTSPDAKTVLYSGSTDRGIVTRTYDVQSGIVKGFEFATLPEKCAWQDSTVVICGVPRTLSSAQYPDAWYQGLLSFKDSIWSVDTKQGITNMIVSPDQDIDVVKVQVSSDKSYVYFMNKTDETLWSYRLAE